LATRPTLAFTRLDLALVQKLAGRVLLPRQTTRLVLPNRFEFLQQSHAAELVLLLIACRLEHLRVELELLDLALLDPAAIRRNDRGISYNLVLSLPFDLRAV
jgi:hypothetical protein